MPIGKQKRRRHRKMLTEMQQIVESPTLDSLVGIGDHWVPATPRLYYGNCITPLGLCRCISMLPQKERNLDGRENLLEIAAVQSLLAPQPEYSVRVRTYCGELVRNDG